MTGGASGTGAALVKHLAREGARVVIADRQAELAESLAVAIRSSSGHAVAMQLDVRERSSMTHVVSDTVARWAAVDYFFNNAGIGIGGEASLYSHTDWDDVLTVNLHGVMHGIEAVYPVMIRQHSGHIINTASMAGLVASPEARQVRPGPRQSNAAERDVGATSTDGAKTCSHPASHEPARN